MGFKDEVDRDGKGRPITTHTKDMYAALVKVDRSKRTLEDLKSKVKNIEVLIEQNQKAKERHEADIAKREGRQAQIEALVVEIDGLADMVAEEQEKSYTAYDEGRRYEINAGIVATLKNRVTKLNLLLYGKDV